MIASARRGQPLPAAADVRRRIGLGLDPASTGVTVSEAWAAWLAGKRKLRQSARARLEQIGEHWLLPVLADVPLERLNGAHVAEVFARIERINAGITAQREDGRAFVKVEGDVRERPRPLGTASQHRVYAALREFANFEVRKTRRLGFNPVYAVELEPEITPEAQRWTAAQARTFLAASADDPLGLLFRIVVLRGARRGEAVGFRWSGTDLDAGFILVERPILLIGSEVAEGRPKSRAGERLIWLDAGTVALLREHRAAQRKVRMKAAQPGRTTTWCSAAMTAHHGSRTRCRAGSK
jgi:integrase